MFVSDCLDVNAQGHLTIGGLDTVELAKEFGTPVYIMDENQIRQHCRDFVESMNETYSGHGHVLCEQGLLLQGDVPHLQGGGHGA